MCAYMKTVFVAGPSLISIKPNTPIPDININPCTRPMLADITFCQWVTNSKIFHDFVTFVYFSTDCYTSYTLKS